MNRDESQKRKKILQQLWKPGPEDIPGTNEEWRDIPNYYNNEFKKGEKRKSVCDEIIKYIESPVFKSYFGPAALIEFIKEIRDK